MSSTPFSSARLEAAAKRLIDVFRHESHNPKGEEAQKLERLLAKLKQASSIARELSLNNHQRLFGHPIEQTALDELIAETERAIEQPLPRKAKRENLYHAMAFDYELATRKRPTLGRTDTPNEFQQFMAGIVASIEGHHLEDWPEFVERTTQHYKRVVQNGQK